MKAFRVHRVWLVFVAVLCFAASSHALSRSTSMMLSNLGDAHHPALVAASDVDARVNWADTAEIIVIDVATFWAAVDEYDCGSDCKAFCASVPVAVISQKAPAARFATLCDAPLHVQSEPLSFIPSIEPPPPRSL
jgi:hypothetical protein